VPAGEEPELKRQLVLPVLSKRLRVRHKAHERFYVQFRRAVKETPLLQGGFTYVPRPCKEPQAERAMHKFKSSEAVIAILCPVTGFLALHIPWRLAVQSGTTYARNMIDGM
jgi:hypothetical protein